MAERIHRRCAEVPAAEHVYRIRMETACGRAVQQNAYEGGLWLIGHTEGVWRWPVAKQLSRMLMKEGYG